MTVARRDEYVGALKDAGIMRQTVWHQRMPNGGNLWVNTKIASPVDGAPAGVIEVKDTGRGIEPHDLPKIFEPFFTAKKRTGLGLGLSVCERIVKNHGGRIEAASQPGEGTQVTVHFPVERKAAMINPG